ncbi:dockerin type I repeat-containing protein, putative [Babesia ovis]|uniref:Dockerin type I repeat-containing protein, putative n=1 Tax=Babesia ovis TaxID=5869 RepID=A0A9W5TAE0_BABOV|nr:dockerin type I repeat-containing protein, putative [Babesia ovis]
MADFCRFFKAAGEIGSQAAVDRLRALLAQERETFRVCLQTLSHLLGLKLNDLIRFDGSLVMKDDVVSIYLSGELPESVIALLNDLDTQPARKHALALQVGKLLKARLSYGLNSVVETLDDAPAKDLYSRSIACLLRITMCALKVECDLRRGGGVDLAAYMVDETGASLCEVLSRCCVVLCIFGAEESNLFDSVKEVQQTLLGLVPGSLILHIIGAFPVIAFDSECLFSLQNRRVFVESLSTILPDILDHILMFNRIKTANTGARKREQRKSRGDIDPVDCADAEDMPTDDNEDNDIHPDDWVPRIGGYNSRLAGNLSELDKIHMGTPVDNSDWEFAFGNVPRVRTLSLLLEFILKYAKTGSDDTLDKHMLGWLEALVSKPSFFETFGPIFSTGDTSNFGKVLELSRMLQRDIFVSHHILVMGDHSDRVLAMAVEAGIDILADDDAYAPRVLAYLVDGVDQRPKEVIQCWCQLLKPIVVPTIDSLPRFADGAVTTHILRVANRLFDAVAAHALMQNFGDECHPDEDNVNALTARQLLVLLADLMGQTSVCERVNNAVKAGHSAMEEPITLESVQVLEYAIFCLWLMKMPENANSQKQLFDFAKQINERTLQTAIELYHMSGVYDVPKMRLDALEKIKMDIRASRLKNMVSNNEPWFEDLQINSIGKEEWDIYYRDSAGEIKWQLAEAVLHQVPTIAIDQVTGTPINTSLFRSYRGGRKTRRTNRKGPQPVGRHNTDASAITVIDYARRAKLLMKICIFEGEPNIGEQMYASILAVITLFQLPIDECKELFDVMLEHCPDQLVYKVHETGNPTLVTAMMNSMASNLDGRLAGLLPEMMVTAMAKCLSDGDSHTLVGLMQVVTSAVKTQRPLVGLLEVDNGTAILQNFIVYVNSLKVTTPHFLEVRGKMNLALVERYVKLGTALTNVPIQQFLHEQLQEIMTARAANFSISLDTDTGEQPPQSAARGELNTLDALIVATFQLFFNTESAAPQCNNRKSEGTLGDVFHWNLLGSEYAIAFKTVALLFSCFSQLSNTKLMFIFEHFVGLAARVNGDSHTTARRNILTDDCLLKPEAIEYLYQVHCQLSKSPSTVHPAVSKRTGAM